MTTTSEAMNSVGTSPAGGTAKAVGTAKAGSTTKAGNTAKAGGTGRAAGAAAADGTAEAAERIWRNLRAVVLERNERRKETSEALGMSFFRIKVLRRVAASPARLSELAAELASDRPYTTLVVDDLAKRGLVERHQHPTDRRCKIVSATAEGHATADRANAILGTPPDALRALPPEDLAALDRIAAALAAAE